MTTKADKQTFRTEDLVLKISKDVDPNIWDETKYDAFLDELCGAREYQKRAIQTTLRYILSGKYKNLRQLARENFDKNDQLRQLHGSWPAMERMLQLPDQLSCSIDLATGTGKSYVLYGLAAILLAEGIVDRVLVLCPSNTIEAGLTAKFKDLAADSNLRDLLPTESKIKVPKIINASESIVFGCICVENYHAILEHVRSSVGDSLKESLLKTAVFSDEAHHVSNESGQKAKRWKEFLANPDYAFSIAIGLSGTCYVGDQYFADVVSRYSLRQAIEERWVKNVEYVAEMPDTTSMDEKWQLICNRHKDWKKRLAKRDIKPLTIVVTKGISDCDRVGEEIQEFLQAWEKLSAEDAAKKVLVVTSDRKHQPNLAKLKLVDDFENPVEWIVSVSMLSEGWDVKNVFQIVPHEERAFNSKLLIAQVLGRGLRRPNGWTGEDPVVTVFNHDRWSARIRHLVNEILEIERRLSTKALPKSSFNFELHTLDYSRIEDTSEFTKKGEYKLLEDGFVDLPTQVEQQDVSIEFERAITGDHTKFKTHLEYKTYSVEDVSEQMYQRIKSIDEESRVSEDVKEWTSYSEKFPRERFHGIIEESLKRASIKGGRVTEENRQKFLQALGTLRRKKAKRVLYKLNPKALVTISTATRPSDSTSSFELRKGDRTVFYPPDAEKNISDDQLEFFAEVIDKDGDFRAGCENINNTHLFKTPVNVVIADGGPERKFIRQLCEPENAKALDAWLKNTNQRFFWIEYAWKRAGKGEHLKRGEFSPDFIIKQGDLRFVVEIKDKDEISEPSIENQKKYEFAQQHFARLNQWLEEKGSQVRYQFNFLTPPDYPKFFQKLKDRQLEGFNSSLDVALRSGD